MKVIAVINQKGGVGKSSTALELGAGLILKGYKVLFIDLDAQGNLSYTMRADLQGYNSMGVLQRPETAQQEIQHTDLGDIIASSMSLAQADIQLTEVGKEYRLREAIESLQGAYDYIIVDTPPALGILTVNALTACTGVIIPARADIYSLQGIGQLSLTIETIRKYCNSALKIMGILITQYNQRTTLGKELSDMLTQTAEQLHTKLYDTKIRYCTALMEAQACKQSVQSYAPKSNASLDYMALLDEILQQESIEG